MKPYDQEGDAERTQDGVQAHESVDLTLPDPTLLDGRRICVSSRKAGGRCVAPALTDGLLCAPHAGRMDPSVGGKAKAQKTREAKERAQAEAALRALGTRAVVAQVFARRAEAVDRTVSLLLDAAEGGDLKSAQALLPWLNQALGNPTERAEIRFPSSANEAQSLPTSQLEALVAQGREARLAASQGNGTA